MSEPRHWFVAVGLAGAMVAGGCSTNPVTGQRELIFIPESQEVAMGKEAAPQFEGQFGGKVPSAELQSYVQAVGQRIAGVADRRLDYNYRLVNSKVPNAFALPGGEVFVTAGLMARMDSERQLAAVLGHETGHICAKHNVKGMQRQMGVSVLAEIAAQVASKGQAGAAKQVAQVVGNMVTLKYTRDDEYQADSLGIKYMAGAGYNPYGMVELLNVLVGLSEKEPGSLEEMFQTHPLTSKRIAEAKQTVQTDHPGARPNEPDPARDRFLEMRYLLLKAVPNAR